MQKVRKLLSPGPKYSWKKVSLILLFSSCFCAGTTVSSYLFYKWAKHLQLTRTAGEIQAIIQTGPSYQPLQTHHLAELLGLSIDAPINLISYDLFEAKQRLFATGLFKKIEMKKISESESKQSVNSLIISLVATQGLEPRTYGL